MSGVYEIVKLTGGNGTYIVWSRKILEIDVISSYVRIIPAQIDLAVILTTLDVFFHVI